MTPMMRMIQQLRSQPLSLALAALLALVGLAACGGNEDYGPDEDAAEELPPDIPNAAPIPPDTSLDCPSGSYLSFNNFGGAFMRNYCSSCHSATLPKAERAGATVGVNFDTAADVQLWRSEILGRAAGDSPTMPPSKGVSKADRAAFREWLNCGAPKG